MTAENRYRHSDVPPKVPHGAGAIGYGILCFALLCLAAATGAAMIGIVHYRLENTSGMAYVPPPPIPLRVLDRLALGAFFLMVTLTLFAAVAVRAAYVKLTGRDQPDPSK
jgi:hypothetical protein